MKQGTRIVGIDFGTRKVGLALADPLQIFAQPVGTFSQNEAIGQLRQWQTEWGLAVIVIGWPLTENGEEGKATARVQEYINRLRRVFPAVTIVCQDERYTSEEARSRLHASGIRSAKWDVDAVASSIILQEYLDTKKETPGSRNRMRE